MKYYRGEVHISYHNKTILIFLELVECKILSIHKILLLIFRIGKYVATYPWQTIIGAWTLVALCSLGFLRFYNERDPLKLWVPKGEYFI